MSILLDTHTLFWFITKDKRLSSVARSTIRNATTAFIPTIVLLELFYLMSKRGLENKFVPTLNRIKKYKKYTITSLDLPTLEASTVLSAKLEIHDRIIVATASLLRVYIVTKDKTVQEVYPNTIW